MLKMKKSILFIIMLLMGISMAFAYVDYDTFTRADGAPGASEGRSTSYVAYNQHGEIKDNALLINVSAATSEGDKLTFPNVVQGVVMMNITVNNLSQNIRLHTGEQTYDAICQMGIDQNQVVYGASDSLLGMEVHEGESIIIGVFENSTPSPNKCNYYANNGTDWVTVNNSNGASTKSYMNIFRFLYSGSFGLGADAQAEDMYICEELNWSCHPGIGGTPSPPDPCVYGGSGDWEIDFANNCTLSTNTDIGSNNLIITGDAGRVTITAEIRANNIKIEPDDFDGDTVIELEDGGMLGIEV